MSHVTTVRIIRRQGAVPAATAHLGWTLYHDHDLVGYFASKKDAETHSIGLLYHPA